MKQRYRPDATRLLLLTCSLPAAMIFTIIMPVLPRIARDLSHGTDGSQARLLLTVVGISMAVGSPVGGWLSDRIGVRPLCLAASLLWIASGTLQVFPDDFRILILLRLVEGGAAAALMVAGTSLLGTIADEAARSSVAGWQTVFATAAGILTLVASGMIGEVAWHFVFLLHLLAFPIVVAAWLMPRVVGDAAHGTRTMSIDVVRHLPWGLVILGFLIGLSTFGVITFSPFLFRDFGVTSAAVIGGALTILNGAMAVSAALLGTLRRRMDVRRVLAMMSIIAATGAALASVAGNYWLLLGALLVFGAGAGLLAPAIYTVAASFGEVGRGRVFGIIKAAYYCSSFVGAIALEPIMQTTGAPGVLRVVAGTLALVAVCLVSGSGALLTKVGGSR